jgi:hypothetical protein
VLIPDEAELPKKSKARAVKIHLDL